MKFNVNLTGLVLCPFQIIFDIAEQLNVEKACFSELLFKPLCKLDAISDWVDLDSLGDPVALRAYEASRLLVSILSKQSINALDLVIHLGDYTLDIDNYYVLLILFRLLDGKLKVSCHVNDAKQEYLSPYLCASDNANKLAIEFFSDNTTLEVATNCEWLNKLTAARKEVLKQAGFDFFDPENETINTNDLTFNSSLIRYVWTGLKSGAYPISIRLLKHVLAQETLSERDKEAVFMHLQHIHFLSHQHEIVVNQAYPDSFKYQTPEIIMNLYFIKAFSATLMRRFDTAESCFQLAGIHLEMQIIDENSLYQLNLLALFYLLKGDIENAFSLEKRLNQYIEKKSIKTTAINYVVLLNIARLYKKSQDIDRAFIFYEKAYQHIQEGGFSIFDSMYYNMDKAGLYEAAEHYGKALTSWVKVALYWLSNANPFSLALKPRMVLCKENVTQTLAPLDREKVSHFLFNKMDALSKKLGYVIDLSSIKRHLYISTDIKHRKTTSYITSDVMIYGCTNTTTSTYGQQEEALQQIISFLLKSHLQIDVREEGLIIESHYESIGSTLWSDYLAMAYLQGCSNFVWNDEQFDRSSDAVKSLLSTMRIRLSKMIQSWDRCDDGIQLWYTRNFLNRKISSPSEMEIINELMVNDSINLFELNHFPVESVISLLLNNVIAIEGVSQHSITDTSGMAVKDRERINVLFSHSI